jgi:predicted secreted protein
MSDLTKVQSGNSIMLFVGSGTTKCPIAYSNSASWESSMSVRNVTSKDSAGFEEVLAGIYSFNASAEALLAFNTTGLTSDFKPLWNNYSKGCTVNIVLSQSCGTSPSWSACGVQLTGKGLITNMSITSNKGDNATTSIKLCGSGAVVLTP